MKRFVSVAAAAGLLGASLVTGGAATAAPGAPSKASPKPATAGYQPPPITWGACESPRLQAAGAECGMLTVPLDYARPSGTKIQIALSRIKHTSPDSEYQGIALTNPGGPGGSGLGMSRLGGWLPDGAGESYDWIGFDPRGVGASVPSLSCDGDYFGYDRPNYIPTTRALEQTWLDKAAGYAAKCDAAGGELLEHVKTTDTVADMESIRKALGEKQINYYGFSYGTYLGQVYSTLHPDRVRRMVWDGVVDPRGVWYDANLEQDKAFDRNINIYFEWIAKHDNVYHLGTTGDQVRATWYATRQKLDAAPALGLIGPDEWTDAFLSAGYYVYGWEDVATAYAAAINDDNWEPIKELYDGANGSGPGSDNSYAMYLGTQCTDVKWPKNWQKWRVDNWRVHKSAPFETWANAWFNAPCLTWGAKAGTPVKIKGKKVPPVLLVAETHDAATPFAGALEVRKRYPNSVLIEGVGGTTHSGSLSGVECTDSIIADYFATGALPARQKGKGADVKCPPVPQPDPQPTTALTAPSGSGSTAATPAPSTSPAGKAKGKSATAHANNELRKELRAAQGH
ncbi:MAG: alpha/beta hydrolase [Micrococcales bacterium]|nr:alpha/beta hydrolase [Micrococcales bacterium]